MNIKNLVIAIVAIIVFTNCSSEKDDLVAPSTSILGIWESTSEKYELFDKNGKLIDSDTNNFTEDSQKETYTFNADGKGIYKSYEDGQWVTSNFTYKTTNNKILTVTLMGDEDGVGFEIEMGFEYKISNGQLILSVEMEEVDGKVRTAVTLNKIS